MGARTRLPHSLLPLAAAALATVIAWHMPASAGEIEFRSAPDQPTETQPTQTQPTQAQLTEAQSTETSRPNQDSILAHLRAGALLDSGAVSVSELRPGTVVDQGQLNVYAATQLKDRLRAGQSLDDNSLQVSALRPGAVDQTQLQVYLAMADEPADTQTSDVDQSMVFLAAMSMADGTEPVTLQTASAMVFKHGGVMPRAMMGVDGVWEFPRLPDNDELDLLAGSPWRVVPNMESQILFLGPDMIFGPDDFVDLINPLQHIPLINLAYRAMTGDQIYGAAQLVDLGWGPLAGATTVFNLALQDITGATMQDYAVAALFGPADYYYDGTAWTAMAPFEEPQQVATLPRRGSSR